MINDMSEYCSLITAHCSLTSVHCSLFTDLCSLFTDLCPLLTVLKKISFSLIHIGKKRIFVVFFKTFLLCLNAREKGGGFLFL